MERGDEREDVPKMSHREAFCRLLPAPKDSGSPAELVSPVRDDGAEAAAVETAAGQVLPDPVNHPPHYTQHPSGVECIAITEHMGFCLGNAVKYIWRADLKHDAIQDLEKARWYLDREIAKRKAAA